MSGAVCFTEQGIAHAMQLTRGLSGVGQGMRRSSVTQADRVLFIVFVRNFKKIKKKKHDFVEWIGCLAFPEKGRKLCAR